MSNASFYRKGWESWSVLRKLTADDIHKTGIPKPLVTNSSVVFLLFCFHYRSDACLSYTIVSPFSRHLGVMIILLSALDVCLLFVGGGVFGGGGGQCRLQSKLQEIFEGLHRAHQLIESRLKAEQVKQRVLQCCRAWEDWAVYPPEFLISLQNIFLGLVKRVSNLLVNVICYWSFGK